LYCMSISDLRILITPLESSTTCGECGPLQTRYPLWSIDRCSVLYPDSLHPSLGHPLSATWGRAEQFCGFEPSGLSLLPS